MSQIENPYSGLGFSEEVEMLIALAASGAATTGDMEQLLSLAATDPAILVAYSEAKEAMAMFAIATAGSPETSASAITSNQVTPLGIKQSQNSVARTSRAQVLGWSFAAAAVASLVSWGIASRGANDSANAKIASMAADCAVIEKTAQAAAVDSATKGDMLRLVTATTSHVGVVRNDKGNELRVFLNIASNEWMVVSNAMEKLPSDQDYQLWLIGDDGAPVSGGLLTALNQPVINQLPRTAIPLSSSKSLTAAVSIEPRGGSSTPTADKIIMAGKIL